MSLKRFNKIFGIQDSLKEEQRRFVQRINQTIFDTVEDLSYPVSYEKVFRTLGYWLGINAPDHISRANRMNYGDRTIVPSLRTLTGDDFLPTLRVLVLLYRFFDDQREQQSKMSNWIEVAISNATVDLGVRWRNGMFYRSGAKILDEQLVEDPFDWLEDYPDERKDFLKAISHYSANELGEVVINCYLVVEGLARKILNNSKTLENNREEILKKVGLSQEWKSFLSNYINYTNEFKRHASDKRYSINPAEVEAFLYFTGLLVRLLLEDNQKKQEEPKESN